MAPEKKRRFRLPNLYIRDMRLEEEEIAQSNAYIRETFTRHKAEGQVLAVKARWAALVVIALLLPILNFDWEMIYYYFILAMLAVIGWLQMRVGRVGRSDAELLLIAADLVLLTCAFVIPNPLSDLHWPTAMQYRFNNFDYFYIFLAAATLAYSWRTFLAFGTWLASLWMSAAILILFLGTRDPELTTRVSEALGNNERYLSFLDPNDPNISARLQEVVVFGIVAAILSLNGWRTNRLLLAQADITRERANLARHFPPSIVERLAEQDEPLGPVRSQNVAILFADVVGFTNIAARAEPKAVMKLLRELHRMLEDTVFNHGGTLDKFLGDGIMATFGTPDMSDDDAERALACAEDILARMTAWNEERQARGEEPLRLSVGLHYGPVILGDIGSERLLEFAVIGDAVNVASRLEAMTRDLGVRLVVSHDLVCALDGSDTEDPASIMARGYHHRPETILRGRDAPLDLWTMA